jgi:hypothetical protein
VDYILVADYVVHAASLLAFTCAGEKAEHVNAVLGPHGSVTKYMSPTNREAFLEHVALRYTRSLDSQMSSLLVHMAGVAQSELEACCQEHTEAMQTLLQACTSQGVTDVSSRVWGVDCLCMPRLLPGESHHAALAGPLCNGLQSGCITQVLVMDGAVLGRGVQYAHVANDICATGQQHDRLPMCMQVCICHLMCC